MILLKQLEVGPLANFIYIVGDSETKECALVDPAWDVPLLLDAIQSQGLSLKRILVTHNHPDHINGIGEVLRRWDVPVHVHRHDAGILKPYKSNLVVTEGGDSAQVGKLQITFLHTPGHTEGSQCFLVNDKLVSGDTLFIRGCGRMDLPNSDPEKMYSSLKKISSLPDETVVFPGHNYAEDPCAPLGTEKKENPYLRISSSSGLQDFLQLVGL